MGYGSEGSGFRSFEVLSAYPEMQTRHEALGPTLIDERLL